MGISRFNGGKVLVCAAGAAVPIAFSPWLNSVFILPKAAVCAAAVTVFVGLLLRDGGWRELRTSVDLPLFAFIAAAALSAVVSLDPRLSWFGQEQDILFCMAGIAGCAAAFYLGAWAGRQGALPALILWTVAAAVPVAFLAVLQAGDLDVFRATIWSTDRRVTSTFGNPMVLGTYLALVAPCALHLGIQSGARRWMGVASGGLAAGALFLTGSRGAWAGAVGGVALYLVARLLHRGGLRSAERRKSAGRFLAATMGAAVLAAVFAGVFFSGAVKMRKVSEMRGSDSARMEIWKMALAEFAAHPLLGSGTNTFAITFSWRQSEALSRIYTSSAGQNSAHNDWLQVLSTMGAAGVLAYAWLHLALLLAAARALREDPRGDWTAAAAAVLAVLIQAKFNTPTFAVAWLAAVFAGGVAAGAKMSGSKGRARIPVVLLAAAAVLFVLTTAGMLVADRQDYLGRRARSEGRMRDAAAHFRRAVAWNPEMDEYRFDLANLLWDVAGGGEPPVDRAAARVYLLAAAETAQEGLRRHPYSLNLHRLLGLAELRRTQWGGEDRAAEARATLERALDLGPNYRYTLWDLKQVTKLQGDKRRTRELESRLERLGY